MGTYDVSTEMIKLSGTSCVPNAFYLNLLSLDIAGEDEVFTI
jgi:hypothetical protein